MNSPEPFSVAAGLFALFSFASLAALHKNFDFFEKSSCFFRKNMIHCYRFPETGILHRGVAQLVEQRSPKPRVQSSSLCSPAKKKAGCISNLLFSVKSAAGGRNPPLVDEIASR